MKLQHAAMLLAIDERDWASAVRTMSAYFSEPLDCITNLSAVPSDAALEVNILYCGYRYTWEEYDGFWCRPSVAGEGIRIFYR
jgi:hypothetical protein